MINNINCVIYLDRNTVEEPFMHIRTQRCGVTGRCHDNHWPIRTLLQQPPYMVLVAADDTLG